MAAAAAAEVGNAFAELERQQELIASCTRLYKQLTDHFTDLENTIVAKSESLRTKRRLLDVRATRSLDSLRRREASIDSSVDAAISTLPSLKSKALTATPLSADDIAANLKSLCAKMDAVGFLDFIVDNRKEVEILRAEIPVSLTSCIDPAKFVMDTIGEIFPVDKREVRSPNDLSWVCVLVLEGVVAALADPEVGVERMLVPRGAKERATEMAEAWKEGFGKRGGVEGARPPDAHAFLQLVATFGIANKEDKWLYRKLIGSFSWRRQMPRLAMLLGLEEEMDGIVFVFLLLVELCLCCRLVVVRSVLQM